MRLYDRLADLPLRVEGCSLARNERETSSDMTRVTTTVSLHGDGHTGMGEDVTYESDAHDVFVAAEARGSLDLALEGEYSLASFSRHLDGRDLFPEPPAREDFRHYRRWAFESAALDLALRQRDTTLPAALGLDADPVRFVVSTRLGDPPSMDRIDDLLDVSPDAEFKLDPVPEWTDDLVADLADLGRVRILDLKGQYRGEDTSVANPGDPDLYERLVEAFPEAVFEDPDLTDETEPIVSRVTERVSWDAPITGIESVRNLPFAPRWLNVKPSRFGTLASLLDTVEYCQREDITMYGGGQFELDVGRGQIQLLASLFYPEGPNDVAPGGYNDPVPEPGLPASPLDPGAVEGFRLDYSTN
ncbi:MAG: hypothetical protein ABEJ06_03330 [Haloarculaceae archaeon]